METTDENVTTIEQLAEVTEHDQQSGFVGYLIDGSYRVAEDHFIHPFGKRLSEGQSIKITFEGDTMVRIEPA